MSIIARSTGYLTMAVFIGFGPSNGQLFAETELAQEVKLDEQEPPKPASKKPDTVIAGFRGITIISKIVFQSAPEKPHDFETNYIFPSRARWWLSFDRERSGSRRADYRYGDRVFVLESGTNASVELFELDRSSAIRRMELRRALFLYPDGFDWELDGLTGTAPLGGSGDQESMGSLQVELDSEKRPRLMLVLSPEGQRHEALIVEKWKTLNDRDWPQVIRLEYGEHVIWNETILKIDPGRRYVDSFFIPVDRRSGTNSNEQSTTSSELRQIDLPVFAYRNFDLPQGTDWKTAFELGREIWKRENKAESSVAGRLDPVVRFEIGPRGQPTFAILHLVKAESLPSEWQLTEARTGLMLVLDSFDQLSRSRIDKMLRSIPVGSRPTPAYVRKIGDEKSSRLQLILPLIPVE